MTQIKVPVFPESIAEGTLASWHKKEGDRVAEGEIVAEIETDKVVMEVPATQSGVIGKILKQEGDTVLSEEVIAEMGQGVSAPTQAQPAPVQASAPATSSKSIDVKAPSFPESVAEGTVATWAKKVGDAVAEGETLVEIETDKVMMEVPSTVSGVLLEIIKQEGDTVLSEELVARVAEGAAVTAAPVAQAQVEGAISASDDHLSPAVRRAVKTMDVNPQEVQGSGKGGRITKQDVVAHASAPKAASQVAAAPEFVGERPEKRVKMTRLRQTVAKRLVEVQHTNAILTTFNEVDMKLVMDLRNKYKDLFQKTHDAKLGFMSFFLKAATEALKRFPEVNASIDADDIVYHGYFDIGVAVGSDRGLVVPVIRNADQKSFAKIESEIVEKAIKARDGKLSLEEMQGGTFTITNGGTYGSMLSTPIINAPQSAILGMHNIVERPIVVNGEIVIRPIMYLALSYDHRIIDGSVSVRFLKTIKELIEDPARLLLEV